MVYIGIDPGLDGAIAAITSHQKGLVIIDTPTVKVGKKREMDAKQAASILKSLRVPKGNKDWSVAKQPQVICALEKVHSMPKQGVASTFTFGKGYGIWLGLLTAFQIPPELVTPQAWKKLMLSGGSKEKGASILRVQQLFPGADVHLKKHDGRADALLLAEYIRRITNH